MPQDVILHFANKSCLIDGYCSSETSVNQNNNGNVAYIGIPSDIWDICFKPFTVNRRVESL